MRVTKVKARERATSLEVVARVNKKEKKNPRDIYRWNNQDLMTHLKE